MVRKGFLEKKTSEPKPEGSKGECHENIWRNNIPKAKRTAQAERYSLLCLRNIKETKGSATERERRKIGKEVRKVGSSAHIGPYRPMNFGMNEMGSH